MDRQVRKDLGAFYETLGSSSSASTVVEQPALSLDEDTELHASSLSREKRLPESAAVDQPSPKRVILRVNEDEILSFIDKVTRMDKHEIAKTKYQITIGHFAKVCDDLRAIIFEYTASFQIDFHDVIKNLELLNCQTLFIFNHTCLLKSDEEDHRCKMLPKSEQMQNNLKEKACSVQNMNNLYMIAMKAISNDWRAITFIYERVFARPIEDEIKRDFKVLISNICSNYRTQNV
jgi:hypothetical protein